MLNFSNNVEFSHKNYTMPRKASTAGVTEYKMLSPNGQNRGKNSDDSASPAPVHRTKIYE